MKCLRWRTACIFVMMTLMVCISLCGNIVIPVAAAEEASAEAVFPEALTLPLAEKNISAQVPILMYHHFTQGTDVDDATMSIQGFEEQIAALSQAGYTAISFDQMIDFVNLGVALPEKSVVITMDDGYLSNYELAFPILQQYDMKATMFVIGVSVGQSLYKNTDFEMIPHFDYEQAKEMVDSGLISIQSHTYDMHQWEAFEDSDSPRINILPLEGESEADYIQVLTDDFLRSKGEIEAALQTAVNVLAYPTGRYCDLSQNVLASLGVEVTLTTDSHTNILVKGMDQSLSFLGRYNMTDRYSGEDLIALLER